jgi:tetratricopeptide (TPR) repeat protein
LNDNDRTDHPAAADSANAEMPWARGDMPCVYCGILIPRDSDRCPECKTSYSAAVRRASREVEGPWYYLESRNPSNRGVGFHTMLKLIEKGRLRRSSIVRGPTTHQDWMFAAETPLLSKHLGVCPHCFAPARGDQEYCDTCYRQLDERPARLKAGVDAPGAESHFPERDALEAHLAEALKTHDLARAATSAAVPTAAATSVFTEPDADTFAGEPPTPGGGSRPAPRPRRRPQLPRRAKLHVVMLLTVVTVIPLAWLMIVLPIEKVIPFGAENIRNNRESVRKSLPRWLGGSGGGDSEPSTATHDNDVPSETNHRVAERMATARSADQAGELDKALTLYREIEKSVPTEALPAEFLTAVQDLQKRIARRNAQRQAVWRVEAIQKALADGKPNRAKILLGQLTSSERELAAAAGHDLVALESKINGALATREEDQRRQQRRREIQNYLRQGQQYMRQKRFDLALVALKMIRDKYPAEDVPKGVNIGELITLAENKGVKPGPVPVEPKPGDSDKAKAGRLWTEAMGLQGRKEYKKAIAKCEEIKALSPEVHPATLDDKIKELKKLQDQKESLEFFLGNG